MCDRRLWAGIMPALEAAGVESFHADVSLDDRIEGMADRALRQLDRPTVVVGFSMGGMVALRMQAQSPERVAALVLIDTNARPDLPERAEMRVAQQRRVQAGGLADVVRAELLPHYFANGRQADAELGTSVTAMADAVGPGAFVRQADAIRHRPDARHGLAGVRCPTIVIGGLEDRLCLPDWQRDLASGIADAEQVFMSGVGHFAPLEDPSALSRSLLAWAMRSRLIG